jgi:hypothetical protein
MSFSKLHLRRPVAGLLRPLGITIPPTLLASANDLIKWDGAMSATGTKQPTWDVRPTVAIGG